MTGCPDITDCFFNRRQVGRAVLCTPRLEADARTLAHEVGAHLVTRPTYSCYPRAKRVGRATQKGKPRWAAAREAGAERVSNPWLNLFGREGLLSFAEFLEARTAAQGIEHWIEPEQCGSERRSGECAKVGDGE